MDHAFMVAGVQANFPIMYHVLRRLPILSLKNFFESRDRLTEVCPFTPIMSLLDTESDQYGKNAFYKYVAQYGRDSRRKDLLTKILGTKSTDEAPLTDLQVYTEIGNLVFAGTGMNSVEASFFMADP